MSHRLWTSLLWVCLSLGCDSSPKHPTSEAPLTSTAATQVPPTVRKKPSTTTTTNPLTMHDHSQVMMGMPFTIRVRSERAAPRVGRDVQAAFEVIKNVEEKMSEWQPHSEVSLINRVAGKNTVVVSPETYDVIALAKKLSAQSKGAFDPTWAAFRGVWQFKKTPFKIPSSPEITQALQHVDYTAITLEPDTRHVGLSKPKMQLGLGAVAKGFAIDAAADVLTKAGYTDFIIDGGGDVYLAGKKDRNTPWRVGIKHPRRTNGFFGYASPENMAIVTSGDYEHHFIADGKRYHHIIDVRNGYPATASVAVTVMAPRAIYADAIATAVFILGPTAGIELVKQYENVKVLVLSPDGEVHGYPHGFTQSFPNRWK